MANIRRKQNSDPLGLFRNLTDADVSSLAQALSPWIQGQPQMAALDAFDKLVSSFALGWNWKFDAPGAVYRSLEDKIADGPISVKDFGAIGDGLVDDTAAFVAASAYAQSLSKGLYAPKGEYLVSSFTVHAGVDFFGDGKTETIIRNVGPAGPDAYHIVIVGNNATASHVKVISSDTGIVCVHTPHTTGATIHDVTTVGGARGIFGYGCTDALVYNCDVSGFMYHGINFEGPGTTRCNVHVNKVDGSLSVGAGCGILTHSGTDCKVTNNYVNRAHTFGIYFGTCEGSIMSGNTVRNTRLEAYQMADSNRCSIDGNIAIWPLENSVGIDFGISLWAPNGPADPGATCDYNSIINNAVINAPKSGISCEGSAGASNSFSKIQGNTVINANSVKEAGSHPAGIALYGAGVHHTLISDNFIYANHGWMPLGIREVESVNTSIKNNKIHGATARKILREATSSMSTNGLRLGDAGTTWNPAITSQSGTIGASSVQEASFYELEHMTYISLIVTVSNKGSAGGALIVSLPYNARTGRAHIMVGREVSQTGMTVLAEGASNSLVIRRFDNADPIVSGGVYVISGWIERD